MSRKGESDKPLSLRDMASPELVDAFCGIWEPCVNETSADMVMYDVDLREFFGCLFQAYQKTGLDLLGGYKILLSDRGFIQNVSYDGRPCYYLRRVRKEDES